MIPKANGTDSSLSTHTTIHLEASTVLCFVLISSSVGNSFSHFVEPTNAHSFLSEFLSSWIYLFSQTYLCLAVKAGTLHFVPFGLSGFQCSLALGMKPGLLEWLKSHAVLLRASLSWHSVRTYFTCISTSLNFLECAQRYEKLKTSEPFSIPRYTRCFESCHRCLYLVKVSDISGRKIFYLFQYKSTAQLSRANHSLWATLYIRLYILSRALRCHKASSISRAQRKQKQCLNFRPGPGYQTAHPAQRSFQRKHTENASNVCPRKEKQSIFPVVHFSSSLLSRTARMTANGTPRAFLPFPAVTRNRQRQLGFPPPRKSKTRSGVMATVTINICSIFVPTVPVRSFALVSPSANTVAFVLPHGAMNRPISTKM